MKLLFLFSIVTLLTLSCSKDILTLKNTSYFFCTSHAYSNQEGSSQNYILITEVHSIERNIKVIKEKSYDWHNVVCTLCKNKSGCTSDLNYYSTYEEACKRRNETLEFYSNQKVYQVDKVEFD